MRERICVRDVEGGTLCEAARGAVVRVGAGVRAAVTERLPDGRRVAGARLLGFGVVLRSVEGMRDLFCEETAGVLSLEDGLGRGAEASDMGGEGGSFTASGSLPTGRRESSPGGVLIIGELAVDRGESSYMSESGMEMSVEMADRWRVSAFLILSCMISASILRSESSSRNLWASMRSDSRSCSPILISSSIMTVLSIATLYLDSMSSRDEVVFLAWRSKSSLATSISRSFSCKLRLVSRRVVISFSRVFWAAFDSAFAFLHFSWVIC